MPVYEYTCRECGHSFEALVRRDTPAACASCGGFQLDRLFPLPAVRSDTTRSLALKAAKKRDAAQGKDRMHEQLRYERTHDRHG